MGKSTNTGHYDWRLEDEFRLERKAGQTQAAATEGLSHHLQESDDKVGTLACRIVKLKTRAALPSLGSYG